MPMMPQRCTLQPEDNTAYIQGLAHNMAPGTAIAVVLTTQPHTQRARKRNKNPDDKHFLPLRSILAGVKGAVALAARRAAIRWLKRAVTSQMLSPLPDFLLAADYAKVSWTRKTALMEAVTTVAHNDGMCINSCSQRQAAEKTI